MPRSRWASLAVLFVASLLGPALPAQDVIITIPSKVNAAGTSATIDLPVSLLVFPAGVTEREVELGVSVSGNSVTFTQLRVDLVFDDGSKEGTFGALGASHVVKPGWGETVAARLELSSFDRLRALGGSTSGYLSVRFGLRGADSTGTQVTAFSDLLPVQVTEGMAQGAGSLAVSILLPPYQQYYLNDVVASAEVRLQASEPCTVQGEISMTGPDGRPIPWSDNPSFSVTVSPGENTLPIPANFPTPYDGVYSVLPTDRAGRYTVAVTLSSHESAGAEETYDVMGVPPPVGSGDRIVLVPGLAEISEVQGEATVTPGQGFEDYLFAAATCTLTVPPMSAAVPGATITNLRVRYYDAAPTVAVVQGGRVEKSSDEEPFAESFGGYLRVSRLVFDRTVDPTADYLTAETRLYIPDLGTEILTVADFRVTSGGFQAKQWDWTSAPKTFVAFGMQFGLNRLEFGLDQGGNRALFRMAGDLKMEKKSGTTTSWETLTSFSGVTFYTDGTVDGTIALERDFDLIPNYVTVNRVAISKTGDTLGLSLSASVHNLPEPLDGLQGTGFELSVDTGGNATGKVTAFNELTVGGGHTLDGEGGNDPTEWTFYVASVDVTYLGFEFEFTNGTFNADHSALRIGADFYLDVDFGSSGMGIDETRISFGELSQEAGSYGDLDGGITIGMDGSFDWAAPSNLELVLSLKYTLDLTAFKLTIDHLSFLWNPDTEPHFAIEIGGGFAIDLDAVDFDLSVANFTIGLDGSIPQFPTISGHLSVMDTVFIGVDELTYWHDPENPTQLAFLEDQTEGSRDNRTPKQGEATVMVVSYLNIEGASIEIKSDGSTMMSGGFQKLCIYKSVEGNRAFILNQARIQTEGVTLTADIVYRESMLRVGGSIVTDKFTVMAAGKIGKTPDGKTSMGIFVAVSGLSIPIYPGVFLDEVGGGIFIYPTAEDISFVRTLAKFERPELELDAKIAEYKPGGAGNPGSFALMFLGGVYVIDKDVISGRALVTITANFFSIDFEVSALKKLVEGKAYLEISWDPAYAEGNVVVTIDFKKVITARGTVAFYFYAAEAWGVMGSVNIAIFGANVASAKFFVGNPGFMLEVEIRIGIDLYVVSGSIRFGGMFWYYRVPDPDTWGAYAVLEIRGEFLMGLFGATAKLEGALIGEGTKVIVYAVGSFSVTVCWIEVFSGSVWISAGSGGFDGGTGRNAKYDGMIEDARNMANAIEEERDQLVDDLHDAQLALLALNPAQLGAAGSALIQRSDDVAPEIKQLWDSRELAFWGGFAALPPELRAIYNEVLGGSSGDWAEMRNALNAQIAALSQNLDELTALHNAVLDKLAAYEAQIGGPLPTIEEMGELGDPFQGYEEAEVTGSDGTTKTVQTGFALDEEVAESSREKSAVKREEFAEYQQTLIDRAGTIDARLRLLDELLYGGEENLNALNEMYANEYTRRSDYVGDLVHYYTVDSERSGQSRRRIQEEHGVDRADVEAILEQRAALYASAQTIPYMTNWHALRQTVIDYLVTEGGEELSTVEEEAVGDITLAERFVLKGTELWWDIPMQGLSSATDGTWERRSQAISSFEEMARSFKEAWRRATETSNDLYVRMSRLYDILYEIYDQLAYYGTGKIGVDGSGRPSGFSGIGGLGLASRTEAMSGWISGQAVQLDAETMELSGSQPVVQVVSEAGLSPAETELAVSTMPEPELSVEDTRPLGDLHSADPTSGWVPLRVYFAARRAEIFPYLEIPWIVEYLGRIWSRSPYEARFLLEIHRVGHPVGVVEFAYKIVPRSGEAPEGGGGGGAVVYAVETQTEQAEAGELASAGELVPWFSFGGHAVAGESFFPFTEGQIFTGEHYSVVEVPVDPAGEYDVYLRVRGAGGKSIVRRASLDLEYRPSVTPLGMVSGSYLDTSDDRPPTVPVVSTNVSMTSRSDLIYASWSASDEDSGIQRYEYGVATLDQAAEEVAGGLAVAQAGLYGMEEVWIAGAQEATPQEPDVLPWTDAGGRTEANIRGFALEHGKRYVVLVRATDGVGKTRVGASPPVSVDLTPPSLPVIAELVQVTADGHPNSVSFSFQPGADPESGVVQTSFALGSLAADARVDTEEPVTDLFPWTPAAAGSATVVDLPVSDGHKVVLTVKSRNGVAVESVAAATVLVSYNDMSPPVLGTVYAGFEPATQAVSFGWNEASDTESPVVEYSYGVASRVDELDAVLYTTVPAAREPYVLGQGVSPLPVPPSDGVAHQVIRLGGGLSGVSGTVSGTSAAGAQTWPGMATAGELDYRLEKPVLDVQRGSVVWGVVKARNAVGLETTRISAPFQIPTRADSLGPATDTTPVEDLVPEGDGNPLEGATTGEQGVSPLEIENPVEGRLPSGPSGPVEARVRQ